MNEYLDGTSESGEWYDSGRRNVYNYRFFDVVGFPFLLSLPILLYSKQESDFGTHVDSGRCFVPSIPISSSA
jgi:hypothetical protein